MTPTGVGIIGDGAPSVGDIHTIIVPDSGDGTNGAGIPWPGAGEARGAGTIGDGIPGPGTGIGDILLTGEVSTATLTTATHIIDTIGATDMVHTHITVPDEEFTIMPLPLIA